ncbi:unnamed protein product [Danaus chrysippus]|uniref:(African queen) hypothetical protein n=1 Tax=Danaus chrysippus TaxID=151541 RepID=A0A8J2WCN4_9NEOP|nr:unnamed protein product [Danaus chrysippus]
MSEVGRPPVVAGLHYTVEHEGSRPLDDCSLAPRSLLRPPPRTPPPPTAPLSHPQPCECPLVILKYRAPHFSVIQGNKTSHTIIIAATRYVLFPRIDPRHLPPPPPVPPVSHPPPPSLLVSFIISGVSRLTVFYKWNINKEKLNNNEEAVRDLLISCDIQSLFYCSMRSHTHPHTHTRARSSQSLGTHHHVSGQYRVCSVFGVQTPSACSVPLYRACVAGGRHTSHVGLCISISLTAASNPTLLQIISSTAACSLCHVPPPDHRLRHRQYTLQTASVSVEIDSHVSTGRSLLR